MEFKEQNEQEKQENKIKEQEKENKEIKEENKDNKEIKEIKEDKSIDCRVNYIFDLNYYKENEQIFNNNHDNNEDNNNIKVIYGLGSGDSYLLLNVLPSNLIENSFNILNEEINWNIMNHKGNQVPRLISIQGDVDEENDIQPLYRHPADEQPLMVPWTPFARICRDIVSEKINQRLNHALIQKYRGGKDNIGEHSDKTLDIELGSSVVNLSIGASRTMILKPKSEYSNCNVVSPNMILPKIIERPINTNLNNNHNRNNNYNPDNSKERIYQKITLPHNSLFVLGWQTNRDYLHSIRQDKRLASEKRPDELLYNETRISLTFRAISTFVNPKNGEITGQGALKKDRWLSENHETTEAGQSMRMLNAFSNENRLSSFDWEQEYGCGFDIVNFAFLNSNSQVSSKVDLNVEESKELNSNVESKGEIES